jgi:hypothetical protein
VRGGRCTNLKNPPSRGVGGAAGVDKMNVLKALLVKTITMLRTLFPGSQHRKRSPLQRVGGLYLTDEPDLGLIEFSILVRRSRCE